MNCAEAKENIDSLIDGELYGPKSDSVEDHFKLCSSCLEIKDEHILLSKVLRTSETVRPTKALDDRVLHAFRQHREKKAHPSWRKTVFGALAIPKPVFAALLVLAVAAPWIAFQIGKIDGARIQGPVPDAATASTLPVQESAESGTKTVVVEVPVVKEKIVTRTIYVQGSNKNRKSRGEKDDASESNVLPSYNSVAHRGYFTDLDLKGFRPPAEIGVQIIKEVKPNEK
jgi:hypothetical protein